MRPYHYDPYRGVKSVLWGVFLSLLCLVAVALLLGMADGMGDGRCNSKPKTRLRALVNQTAPYKLGCYLGERP